jgi:serine kinase of HPr protein (carbohydrate metabolism regulator)
MMLRQTTAVAIGGRALLIEGPPGCGKSTLALRLIDRGATLIGDDGVSLTRRDQGVWLGPAPATTGLIELRGIGILTLPTAEAPAALILQLAEAAPRYPDAVAAIEIAGVAIPALPFDGSSTAAAIRAEHALIIHGLPL